MRVYLDAKVDDFAVDFGKRAIKEPGLAKILFASYLGQSRIHEAYTCMMQVCEK